MQSIALVVHVLLAIGVIGLVLIQHGKGADAGAAFGSGASATVFGARGSASFLTRATTVLAGCFFLTSLGLFYIAAHRDGTVRSVTDSPSVVEEAAPATGGDDLPGGVESDDAGLPAAPVADDVEGETLVEPPAADGEPAPAATDGDLPPAPPSD